MIYISPSSPGTPREVGPEFHFTVSRESYVETLGNCINVLEEMLRGDFVRMGIRREGGWE